MIEASNILQNRIAIDAMNKNIFVSADEDEMVVTGRNSFRCHV